MAHVSWKRKTVKPIDGWFQNVPCGCFVLCVCFPLHANLIQVTVLLKHHEFSWQLLPSKHVPSLFGMIIYIYIPTIPTIVLTIPKKMLINNVCNATSSLNQQLFFPSWPEKKVVARLRNPTQAIGVSFFFVSFNLVNGIVLINVAIAVLLEKMVDDESDKHHHEVIEESDGKCWAVALWCFCFWGVSPFSNQNSI